MINILIPMAGRGSRFKKAGYKTPKPFISIGDKAMIEWVVINLWPKKKHRFIFLCLKDHEKQLRELFPESEIITIDHVTEGAACTALAASHLICNKNPLVIAACDQFFESNINDFLKKAKGKAGMLLTFPSDDPSHSFCKVKGDKVVEVAEKKAISNHANLGIYYFNSGIEFIEAAAKMIKKDIRHNNEFYIAPVYNQIEGDIGIYEIEKEKAHILGTPEKLGVFLGKIADNKIKCG